MVVDVGPVLKEWLAHDVLVQRAAVQQLVTIELGVTVSAAEAHNILLAPVMKHLGSLPAD